MFGLGTIVNTAAIIVAGILGILIGKLMKERFQETIIKITGFGVIAMSIGSTLARMLTVQVTQGAGGFTATLNTQGIMMMMISLALGALVGEIINIEKGFERFGNWLKAKAGAKNDTKFIDGFLTASLTVCVGAMAILGPIQDGVYGDYSTLFSKSIIDFIFIMALSTSMGKGCVFSAIPCFLIQGLFTVLGKLISPIMTEAAISNLSLVGNVLIMCVGVNLVWPKTIRVANVVPAIVFAVAFAFLPFSM